MSDGPAAVELFGALFGSDFHAFVLPPSDWLLLLFLDSFPLILTSDQILLIEDLGAPVVSGVPLLVAPLSLSFLGSGVRRLQPDDRKRPAVVHPDVPSLSAVSVHFPL